MSKEEKKEPAAEESVPDSKTENKKSSMNKAKAIIGGVVVVSLLLYLLSGRFTPSTSQSRVQGYVVGVAPNVAGVVVKVWVQNNHEVKEAQPLFEIDATQYEINLQKAKSDLETARRQVDAGTAAVEAARAGLSSAQANARKAEQDYMRQKRLREEDPGTISLRRLEIAEATLEQAKAGVVSAEAQVQGAIEQKGGENDEDNAKLKSAQSAVATAEKNLADTVVRASTAGVVTDLTADVGSYAGAGAPVLTLISVNDVWVEASFTENNLGHMKAGNKVEILLDSLPGRVFKGEIRSVGLGVGDGKASSPGTLPAVENSRDWLRQAQRFPVSIGFAAEERERVQSQLRIGGQATVIAYTPGHPLLNLLGKIYIRLVSLCSYAY
jgi:multidrug resistance efflux pump